MNVDITFASNKHTEARTGQTACFNGMSVSVIILGFMREAIAAVEKYIFIREH